jgi:phage/plasmid-associated DNA primase
MLTNDLPELTETGDAVRRRLEIIKFTVKFSDSPVGNEKKIDRGLKDKLLKFEIRNEFMLMLFDILRTSTHDDVNVKRPKASSEALNKYMADNDAIIPYISDYLQQTTNEKDRIGSSELFEHYIKNTPDGIPKFTTQKFAKSLESHGFEKKKSNGCMVWVGVKFKEPKQDEEEEEPEQKPEPEPIPEQKPEPKKKKMIKDKWFGMIEEDEVECPALEKRRERIKNFKTETLQIKGKALDHLAQAFGKPSKDPFAITFD